MAKKIMMSADLKREILDAIAHESRPLAPTLVDKLKEQGLLDKIIFDSHTPLTFAAKAGVANSVERLLAAGADPGAANEWGQCPLMWASNSDFKLPIAIALMDAGASLEQANQVDDRPIHTASFGGCMEIIRELIARGADIEAPGQDGWSPIHMACKMGNVELVQLLIGQGADIDRRVIDQDKRAGVEQICMTWSFINLEGHMECLKVVVGAKLARKEAIVMEKATRPKRSRRKPDSEACAQQDLVDASAPAAKKRSPRI